MFVLVELRDVVRIPPHLFHMKLTDAINDELNRKLANKVLINVGLCITMHSLVAVYDSKLLPGDGASHTDVLFRYIAFRPALDTLIIGKIRSCTRDGVYVTLGFFDDIHIPPYLLQYPARFEEAEQAWVWEYPLEDDSKHDLYMDIGEPIKFRVVREIFEECAPLGPVKGNQDSSGAPIGTTDVKTPYRIIVSSICQKGDMTGEIKYVTSSDFIAILKSKKSPTLFHRTLSHGAITEPGLGLLSWWDKQVDAEEEEEEQEQLEEEKSTQSDCETEIAAKSAINEETDEVDVSASETSEQNLVAEQADLNEDEADT